MAVITGDTMNGWKFTMDPPPVFLVWKVDGPAPTTRHPTEEKARNEAERLSRKHPGDAFMVLRSVGTCRVEEKPVTWSEFYRG